MHICLATLVLVALCICALPAYVRTVRHCKGSCTIMRAHGLRMANCNDRELKEVPCLSSNIEVVDLSFNRLRRLTRDDLSTFGDLKILYLGENAIMRVDDDAFTDMDDLEVLDLSLNSFQALPPVIFHLPSLRKLYLGHNANANIVDIVETARGDMFRSPLELLDLSCNEMERLPLLGVLPTLLAYNISGNYDTVLSTAQFAGLCNLKYLYNQNTSARFENACECWRLEQWLLMRPVRFEPFECESLGDINGCSEFELTPEERSEYDLCMRIHGEQLQHSKLMNTILPAICTCLVVLLLIAVCCIMRRRRRRRNARKDELNGARVALNEHY